MTKSTKKQFKKAMAEEQKVLDLLNDKKYLSKIVETIQQIGVVGEELLISSEVLICVGKKTENKEPISTNAHPEDKSGVGKDYVTSKVSEVVFFKDWIKFISPSPTSITYSQEEIFKPVLDENEQPVKIQYEGKDKDGCTVEKTRIKKELGTVGDKITRDKIIYLEDVGNDFLNCDDCKMLLGDDVNTTRTKHQKQIRLKWRKPVVILTTAATHSNNQIIRRLPSLSLDSSKNQTERIVKINKNKRTLKELKNQDNMEETIDTVRRSFYMLKNVYVALDDVIPLIEELESKNKEVYMRSLSNRLYDYIAFSTTLHQYQRKKVDSIKGKDVLGATKDDVKLGFKIFKYIYRDELEDVSTLNKRQKEIFVRLKENEGNRYSVTEIMGWKERGDVTRTTLQSDLDTLLQQIPSLSVYDLTYPPKYGYDKKKGVDKNDWELI